MASDPDLRKHLNDRFNARGITAVLATMRDEVVWRTVTKSPLAKIGATTIGQLAASSPQSVGRMLGHAVGQKLTALVWNRDPRQIQKRRRAHSPPAHNPHSHASRRSRACSNRRQATEVGGPRRVALLRP